ncbi:hypothetical protein [Actinophytocola sediminis]
MDTVSLVLGSGGITGATAALVAYLRTRANRPRPTVLHSDTANSSWYAI